MNDYVFPLAIIPKKRFEETPDKIHYIQKIVSEFLDVPVIKMKSASRKHEVVFARHVAMYLIRNNTNYKLKDIGFEFGWRDHTTVINAVEMVKQHIDTDYRNINSLLTMIQQKYIERN